MRAIVEFKKLDRFIGHLDILRAFQRTISRANLPAQYSNGYHPHMLISLACPTSVGQAGLSEYVDIGVSRFIEEADFLVGLRNVAPLALPPVRCRMVLDSHPKLMAMLRTASYDIKLEADAAFETKIEGAIHELNSLDFYLATRKSKTKTAEINIRPMIKELTFYQGTISARVAFTEAETVKPDLLLSVICQIAKVSAPHTLVTRTGLFGEYSGAPVPLIDM